MKESSKISADTLTWHMVNWDQFRDPQTDTNCEEHVYIYLRTQCHTHLGKSSDGSDTEIRAAKIIP